MLLASRMAILIEAQLTRVLQSVLERMEGSAAAPSGAAMPPVWEIPKDPAFGDLANSVAFRIASRRKQPPPVIAESLADALRSALREAGAAPQVDRVEAKAGFVNVFLSQSALAGIVQEILRRGPRYGDQRAGSASSINIEFVSANPTGPLSVAHGRQAAVGDVLGRLLRSQGHRVTTEYYLNDEGRQIDLLGQSERVRYLQALGRQEPFPEDGYHGLYVVESAGRLAKQHGERLADRPAAWFAQQAMAEQLADIRRMLSRFGLHFDRWTSQQWLRKSGRIDRSLKTLQQQGALYDADSALWFASTRYGDDKDRVVRKRDGELTYLAPDIAYHQWKFEQGYDQLVNLWGPDHHGYIARVKAAMTALGLPAEQLTVRMIQLVTLSRDGKPVPMSKRQGEFVTFEEIINEVGVDATRFFYLMRTMDSQLGFDLDLAKSQSQENPVYYIQYAHARICSILAKDRRAFWQRRLPRFELLTEPEERLLMRGLFQYPVILRLCAAAMEPHGLTGYLRKVAEAFHVFYAKHRVIGEDLSLTATRLALVKAARQVLANGLGMLGITAPRRM